MKILITGAKGQLGNDVLKELKKKNHCILTVDINDFDITDKDSVDNYIYRANPDAVIHCAAYTAVDDAEENVEKCMSVNVRGTENISSICESLKIKMMYVSSDYVFNGKNKDIWLPDDICDPINVYGKSKYLGELAVQNLVERFFIIRISWLFGSNGLNFVKTMIKLGKTKSMVSVVNDQFGSPTYTKDLAVLIGDMIETERYGTYHATNEGFCSWYEFSCEIYKQLNMDINVKPIDSVNYPTKAKRPSNSCMDKSKLIENGFNLLPNWKDALSRYLKEINN